jgi:hypothetical protein
MYQALYNWLKINLRNFEEWRWKEELIKEEKMPVNLSTISRCTNTFKECRK